MVGRGEGGGREKVGCGKEREGGSGWGDKRWDVRGWDVTSGM